MQTPPSKIISNTQLVNHLNTEEPSPELKISGLTNDHKFIIHKHGSEVKDHHHHGSNKTNRKRASSSKRH